MPAGRMQYSFLYVHAYQLALFLPTLCDSPVLTLEDAHSHDPTLRTPLPPVRMQVSLDIDGVALVNASTMLFRYEREPIISGMQPAHGPPAGGTRISLYGTFPGYFQSSEVMCSFQSMNTNVTEADQRPALTFAMWLSATRMSCVAPQLAAGFAKISLGSNGQNFSTSTGVYEYTPLPTVHRIAPSSGPVDGSTLTVYGDGFRLWPRARRRVQRCGVVSGTPPRRLAC